MRFWNVKTLDNKLVKPAYISPPAILLVGCLSWHAGRLKLQTNLKFEKCVREVTLESAFGPKVASLTQNLR